MLDFFFAIGFIVDGYIIINDFWHYISFERLLTIKKAILGISSIHVYPSDFHGSVKNGKSL